jgi:cyclopropane fatty-acyl-phospholipid synthase-like methyltransferase
MNRKRTSLPDERGHAGPEHLDPEYVAAYEAKAQLDVDAQVDLLRKHGLGPEATLVDLGAGTGLVAAAAAQHCRRVVAVDPSPAMIEAIRARGLEAVEAGFLTYEHQGDPPEVVYSRNALHHLSDYWKGIALTRIHDLLAPSGTLVLQDIVYSFEPNEADQKLEEWLAGAAVTPNAGWTRAELEEHVRTESSTYAWLLETLLEHTGFKILDSAHRRDVYGTYVCAKL